MLSNLKADFEKQHVLFKASVDKEDVLKMNTLKMDLKTDLIKLQSIQNMVNIIIQVIIYTGLFWRCLDQKNVPAGFSMSSSYILSTDSKTVFR